MSISEIKSAIQKVENAITEEVHKGTRRDKSKIHKLQAEHAGLTRQLGDILKKNPKAESVEPKPQETPAAEPSSANNVAYCQKCKAKRNMKDAHEVSVKNNKKGMKGQCEVCNRNLFRLIKS